MNNPQRVINQITKNDIKFFSNLIPLEFVKTRRSARKDNRKTSYDVLVIYKNLG